MADLTEIYICGKGQSLKEGKAVYSDEVRTKNDAIRDAKSRCDSDSRIAKIGYYTVSENGDFKCIYMHSAGSGATAEKKTPPSTVKRKAAVAKKKPKASLWQKMTGRG